MSMLSFLKFVPDWLANVSAKVLLPAKIKLINGALVTNEFEGRALVVNDLKQTSLLFISETARYTLIGRMIHWAMSN